MNSNSTADVENRAPGKSAVAHGLFAPISVDAPACLTVAPRKKTTSAASAAELARMQEALRQSEASRRESQAFFERSFHANPTLMSIASAEDRKIIEVNPSLLRASGYTREELIGKTTEKGLTLVPLRVYLKNGRLKCELALARGRKLHDKREVSKMKTIDKEARQAVSQRK